MIARKINKSNDPTFKPVLVLNAMWEPVNITTRRRAVCLLVKETATILEGSLFRPEVIRLGQMKRVPHRGIMPSRKSLLMRDDYTCQYCWKKLHKSHLTMDHVVPKAKGGPNTWDNLVIACRRCNRMKGDRTPEEAKMMLLHPITKNVGKFVWYSIVSRMSIKNPSWSKYCYQD